MSDMSSLTPHQRSALEFTDHLSLTANAGSGKTFVLARRFLNAALKNDVSVSNIAAITFTDKAASELYNKIVDLVNEKITSSDTDDSRQKYEKLRRQLVSANISTIHSFCINILREYPVEAGLDARFITIDELLSHELIELSVEETIKKLLEDESSSETVKSLIRILGSKSKLETELIELIKKRKNILSIRNSIYKKEKDQIVKYFVEQFEFHFRNIWMDYKDTLLESLRKINDSVITDSSNNEIAIKINNYVRNLHSESGISEILRLLNGLSEELLTSKRTIKIRGYLKTQMRDSLTDCITIVESILSELSRFNYSENADSQLSDLADFGLNVIELFDAVSAVYETKKNNEGFLDYEDILLHTKSILQNENVQKSLSEKFKFILVDEYQDTNEIQYEIFLPVLDYLRSGKLFIVGDEKQSIYMFRDAELEIFYRTKQNISSVAGTESLLELPDSFRMAPAICLFANKLFNVLFKNPKTIYNEVKNTEIVCARSDDEMGKVEFLISDEKISDRMSEAELVAARILQLAASGRSFGEIAVLVRKRVSFAVLEEQFIKYRIPFTIIGGRGFYQKQSISDVYNYLSFLSNSSNSAALAGILRSPFFSLPDSLLFEISLQKGDNFWNKVKAFSDQNEKLKEALNILEENLLSASSMDLTLLLRKILSDSDYLAVIASRINAEQELANIEKLINISRNFSTKGFRNLYDFISYLGDSIKGVEDESQAAVSPDTNAVQMMTLHQAKGLEFPVVFLFKTHEAGLKSMIKSKQVSVSKQFGILTKLPLRNNYLSEYVSTPINNLFDFFEEKKRIAELKRLLYVGITRAKDHLIISGEVDENRNLKKDSFLGLIDSGIKPEFDSDNLRLNNPLKYLKHTGSKFKTVSMEMMLDIPINKSVIIESELLQPEEIISEKKIVNVEKLKHPAEKEIISATKIAVYNQCPVKYLLTYEFGFNPINNQFNKKQINFENIIEHSKEKNNTEDDETTIGNLESDIKGSLIHWLLEDKSRSENLHKYIKKYLLKNGFDETLADNYTDEIIPELNIYFNSEIYKYLSAQNNYKNEFEIYSRDESTYLFGIIDKLIIKSNEIIIVDYKTDNIEESEIENRAENYFIQLEFYLYLVLNLFDNYKSFKLILLFIKHPNNPVIKKVNMDNISLVKTKISDIIKGIIQKKYFKKLDHCTVCTFSDQNNICIMN